MLEVLISMGVLAVGLLGVAALIPAGRHEIAQGSRLDYSAMVGRASFRDLQIRGFLNPGNATGWQDITNVGGTRIWDPGTANQLTPFTYDGGTNHTSRVAVAIDPLGVFPIMAAGGTDRNFPYGALLSDPHLTRVAPIDLTSANPRAVIDTIFRASVDLTSEENTLNRDLPPLQFWFKDSSNNPLRRASAGSYSWLATIVSDPTASALSSKVTVSVAVFHKRNLSSAGAGESVASVNWPYGTFSGAGVGGGEFALGGFSGQPFMAVKPGQWIMLAGRQIVPPASEGFDPPEVKLDYFRWYRVVTADKQTGGGQNVTLAGTDWNSQLIGVGNNYTRAFIFENIVAVYEKDLSLELE